jgi:hypothetical protein
MEKGKREKGKWMWGCDGEERVKKKKEEERGKRKKKEGRGGPRGEF